MTARVAAQDGKLFRPRDVDFVVVPFERVREFLADRRRDVADILLAILQGTILRQAVLGDVDLDALRRGVRALWPLPPSTPRERTP